jgi:hypothetical protein
MINTAVGTLIRGYAELTWVNFVVDVARIRIVILSPAEISKEIEWQTWPPDPALATAFIKFSLLLHQDQQGVGGFREMWDI